MVVTMPGPGLAVPEFRGGLPAFLVPLRAAVLDSEVEAFAELGVCVE